MWPRQKLGQRSLLGCHHQLTKDWEKQIVWLNEVIKVFLKKSPHVEIHCEFSGSSWQVLWRNGHLLLLCRGASLHPSSLAPCVASPAKMNNFMSSFPSPGYQQCAMRTSRQRHSLCAETQPEAFLGPHILIIKPVSSTKWKEFQPMFALWRVLL